MIQKVQLNDEQWKTLQALLEAKNKGRPIDSIKVSDRLNSNGLVAMGCDGSKFVTDQGLHRLSRGRLIRCLRIEVDDPQ